MSNDLIPVGDVERMAIAVAKSRLFGVQTPEQAMALMLVAQAEGRHPAIAARDYHIIEGRPTLKADAILARFQEAGGKVEWHCYTDEKVEATFFHPQGGSLRIAWTIADAKRAGLGASRSGKPTPWQTYPRAMLRARLISEGIRTIYPGVLCGMYTPEEATDFGPHQSAPPQPERPMGEAKRVDEPPQPPATSGITIGELRDAARRAINRTSREDVLETLLSLGYRKADEVPDAERPSVLVALEEMAPLPAEAA